MHSYQVGFAWASLFLFVAGIIVLALVKGGKIAASDSTPVHFG